MNYITDKLITPYKIGLDENQFTLVKDCTIESGENIGSIYSITIGYYSSFEALLIKLVRLLASDKNYDTIKEYIDTCRLLYSDIHEELKLVLKNL